MKYSVYCPRCGYEEERDEAVYECPKCGNDYVHNTPFQECDCGTVLPLTGFTNVCPTCGTMYNGFGQKLAPVSEWDLDDVYDCFGPQNGDY